jgi:hypothetical protein
MTPTPPRTRSVLVIVTIPSAWERLSQSEMRRKFRHPLNADRMIEFLADEVHRNVQNPDASPELLLSRVASEIRAAERKARDTTPETDDA